MRTAVRVHRTARSWQPRGQAVARSWTAAVKARARNALEPEWEARFEARSYGFRPGRGCQDAAQAIYLTCKGRTTKRVWAFDADLASAFDRIDHSRLLAALGSFPRQGHDPGLAQGRVLEPGREFAPTEEGTPQAG